MKVHKAAGAGGAAMVWPILILAILLGILFWRSFLPNYVHFSNDGPLGQQNNNSAHLPDAFLGTWSDNNDIGDSGGAWSVSISAIFRWAVGAVNYAKFLVPFTLFILGLGAFSFFRQLKLSPLAATLGALAAALSSTFFSSACWGVAPQEIAIGMDYFALALVVSLTAETPLLVRLARLGLAGLCVGMNVMEAADIGAIFSMFVSAFVVVNAFNQERGGAVARLGKGIWQVAVVAVFAGFIACQTVVSLMGTSGIADSSQAVQSKQERWDWATQWSLPKTETLSLFVPGLYGYKMDTPANMDPEFAHYYAGGNYWGGMGRDASWDRYYAAGSKGDQPQGMLRQTSGTDYCGVLVVLVAIWAAAQSLRKNDSVFSETQRRYVWFWAVVAVLCVLFAWGRFSIFYGLLYKLPYFSTIRSPTKFLIVFAWGIVVLFAYGIDAFSRRYLVPVEKPKAAPLTTPLPGVVPEKEPSRWEKASGFDRAWAAGSILAVVLSLVGWLIFRSDARAFSHYLQTVGFPNDEGTGKLADMIAAFSIHQAGCFVVLLAVAVTLTLLIIFGFLAGRLAVVAGILLGLFLAVDMGRADLPYITHWDYIQKYDIDTKNPGQSTNPIINVLKDKYYEHRVAGELPFRVPEGLELFGQLYTIEWVQHQFPYYNIQTLDLFQRPRPAANIVAYENAVYFHGRQEEMPLITRQWELTNTRYLLGAAAYIDFLNSDIDPVLHRFRIVERFNIGAKPGVDRPTQLEQITALPDPNGSLALFEFTGALPRAKLYSNWQVNTNDAVNLKTLASPAFNPAQTVLISTPEPGLPASATNENKGTVDITSYKPATITLSASTPTPAVLLYNSKWDADWKVTVDGQPQPVLRCNYIMRGVFIPPGSHTVEFKFRVAGKQLYVTLAAYGVGLALGAFLLVSGIVSSKKRG